MQEIGEADRIAVQNTRKDPNDIYFGYPVRLKKFCFDANKFRKPLNVKFGDIEKCGEWSIVEGFGRDYTTHIHLLQHNTKKKTII